MPERLSEREVATVAVQGEGSWVRILPLTVGEILDIQQQREVRASPWFKVGRIVGWVRRLFRQRSQVDDTRDLMLSTFAKVSAWNWVDAKGDPLPQPKDEPSTIFQLTNDEYTAIFGAVYSLGTASEQQKN